MTVATMTLRPYQEEAKESIKAEWEKGHRRTLLVLPTGCHAERETVLMADGTIRAVETVNVGDRLMGSDGTARTVLHLTRGNGDLFKIIPTKGEPFIVTGDHKLTLVRTGEKSNPKYPSQRKAGQLIDVTVNEWLGWSKWRKHIHKLIRANAIDTFETSSELPLDPYFLGVLLGDGGLTTTINVTTPEPEVVKMLHKEAHRFGMHLESHPAGKAKTYTFKGGGVGRNGSKLHQLLVDLELRRKSSEEKAVPGAYKTAPLTERLQAIAGLIDSDGSYNGGGGFDFVSKSQQLAEDLAFMCRSVGLAAYVTETVKTAQNDFSGTYYRVSISGDCSIIPCRVERKRAPARRQVKDVLRSGFTVEFVGTGNYYGFTVDGDNRYLLSDFTITHNCGKTIVFSKLTEDMVRDGKRVLILAHRGELLEQAADKLFQATGLRCAVEKAEHTSIDSWYRVVVGSVQSMMREARLHQFDIDHFDVIIVDEAHHALADSYQRVLNYFEDANVLGVTATPDRGDMRNLGEYFESLAYEYTLPKAIKEGYLSPIKAQTIPLQLDISSVSQSAGDFSVGDLGTALDPYLEQIADEMVTYCQGRRTLVFLPLIATSQKFRDILESRGFRAGEVNGESPDRDEVLEDFQNGRYEVLCNSMLLTEGYDNPAIDCVVVLRPTRVRSLYSQMVGRGTRLHPGKDHLLLLDFLWHTERHDLVHPAHLIAKSDEVAQKMTENIEEDGGAVDIMEAETQAESDVIEERERSLAKKLAEMRRRKRQLVDPLQFEMSIAAEDLTNYVPSFGWEMAPPSDAQKEALEKAGIFPEEIDNAGKASLLLDKIAKRRVAGLSTPKQIRFLEGRGFQHVGKWQFEQARNLINRIAANGWKTPRDINPAEYVPEVSTAATEEMTWLSTIG